MHLIYILVIVVAVLTILSAFALIFGSSKSEKGSSVWFLAAAIGEAIWGVSIAVFLSLSNSEVAQTVAPWLVKGIYIGALLMDTTILGYVSWRYKWGKMLTSFFLIIGIALSAILCYDPSVLYSSIELSNVGNRVVIDMSRGFYVAYIAFFCTLVPSFCLALIYRIRHTNSKKMKKGYLFFLIGLAVAGFMSLIFDLIMPIYRYDLIWVGPLLIGLTILGFYYAILRFKIISLNTKWLRVQSYIVIIGSALIVYLLIFHLVFSALFKIANPSFQVILLNFIMIAIVLLLMPAISEVHALTKSWILTRQIDIAYIVKKITSLNRKKMDLRELAGFLAEHAHFAYVGFLVNGRFYGSDDFKMTPEELVGVSELAKPERGMWQSIGRLKGAKELEISRVGVMTNANGEVVGQVILGKPTTKTKLDRKDLTEVEMIFNLIAVVIENGGRIS